MASAADLGRVQGQTELLRGGIGRGAYGAVVSPPIPFPITTCVRVK